MKKRKLTLLQRVDRAISSATGREHQYAVQLVFRPKGYQGIPHTWTVLPAMTYRPHPKVFYRSLKQHYGKQFISGLKKLGVNPNNGTMSIGAISYLGRF
ncbi:MAG: hypothetical protein ACRCTP_17705 [Aeromonas popoffii]|uniref:hypothetical protein n=1 Tax=Aeromonas popoffii TaxID=70856 RepID=UPI003F386F8D